MTRRESISSFRLVLAAALCLGVVAPLAAGAPIYQWRDTQGGTHFGDTPPPSARQVRLRQSGAAFSSTQAEEGPAIDQAACERKRAQLKGYQQADAVTETNALGEVREYTPAERQTLIATTEAQVRDACGETLAAQ